MIKEDMYFDYGVPELCEGDWDGNDLIAIFKYTDDIAFKLMYPGDINADEIEKSIHFMIYKDKYIDNPMIVDETLGFCRLNILKPEYITGYNETYKLTNDEIEFIYNKLQGNKEGTNISVWEYTLKEYVDYYYNLCELDNPYKNLEMPNYLILKEE